jgi:glutathione S-transferase
LPLFRRPRDKDIPKKVYFAPNSRAVRPVWLLEEIGLPYELERFTIGQREMRGPEYTRINPNGRVPALIDGDTAISESTAIAQYLGARYAQHLAPGSDVPNFALFLQWLHYAEGMIMPPINNYVVETVLLPPDRRNPEMAARAVAPHCRNRLRGTLRNADDRPKLDLRSPGMVPCRQ